MASTVSKFSIPQLQKFIQSNSETLRRCFHTAVTIFTIGSILGALLGRFTSANWSDINRDKFVAKALQNTTYLFSFWITGVNIVHFCIYSVIDYIEVYAEDNKKLAKRKECLNKFASYLLFTLVFPVSVLVTLLFWGFYFYDRETIYPRKLDEVFHPILNHAMHTLPAPGAIVYMFTSNKYEPPKSKALIGLMGFISLYAFFLCDLKLRHGQWPYLILDILTHTQLCSVLFVAGVIPVLSLFLGYSLNSKLKMLTKYLKSATK